ncbi:probable long-chain-alcohol O-fatty-acyltransferase 5 [Telopea speciosissima]|uniref:probable long-chain-alcohol O-fatty-acyltransferase 5 n=1 Tax=Telopea speciosissima TaxID=54955 RepID=UPI001CC39365|nr:probable long-chain-alcohol O-fatty-acyltransferase 5 [Telopea speciosissima]
MEGGELKNIFKVWVLVFASLSYCYLIARRIAKGKLRLLSIIPVLCLFLLLPLNFSSIHLRGLTAFFLSWLANFKLLLFAFGKGPLSLNPSMPLLRFISVAYFPIKIKYQSPNGSNGAKENNHSFPFPSRIVPNSPLFYSIKVILLAVVLRLYDYSQYIHPLILRFLNCTHIYIGMETVLITVAYLARLLLGLELEPTFKEPYLSISLQDFWSRRWNLMVSKILHPTVYEPTRRLAVQLFGIESEMSRLVAILNTFFVSGLMHMLVWVYVGCWHPTWKTMFFFALNGVCLAAEVAVKKAVAGRWQLHPVVSWLLVNGFLFGTISWLLLSDIVRCQLDIKGVREYKAFEEFIKDVSGYRGFHGP